MTLIRAEQIEKTYDKGGAETHALRSVSLSIEKGEFVAIVGPSGSGKSTMLQILGLLDSPTGGKYYLNDEDTALYDDEELAKKRNQFMGFIFQSFNLLARTSVLDNVMLPLAYSEFPRTAWRERAVEQIEKVKLSNRIGHESNELSGGERQRVAIARALVNEPEVVFADEPTGNLDSASGKMVMDMLEELHHEGKTIILITHDRVLAQRAHRALVFRDGNIIWDGKASDIPQY